MKWIGSPNFSKGRNGMNTTIDRIVCHWIVGKLESADVTFQNTTRNTSAHYGVGDDEVHGYVKEEDTAYHAGVWAMNLRSLGIEHEGGPDLPISEETYKTSAKLIGELCKKYNIPLDREHIIKHNEVRATQCPGTLDLDKIIRLAKEGVVVVNNDWLKGMFGELGIDVSRTEGEVRGRVQEVIDGYKKYQELESRITKMSKDLAFSAGQAAQFETELVLARGEINTISKALQEAREAITARDTEVSRLTQAVEKLNQTVDPETKVVLAKDEYVRLIAKKNLDRFTKMELIQEIIHRVFKREVKA